MRMTNEMFKQMPQQDRIEYLLQKHIIVSEYEDMNWFYYSIILLMLATLGIFGLYGLGMISAYAAAHLVKLIIWFAVAYGLIFFAILCYALYCKTRLDWHFIKRCFNIRVIGGKRNAK